MYPIPSFSHLHQTIVQEIRNQTGLSISADSDASIRADGTASIVEGLYQHQHYIQRQLFIQTADEPYLYLHAEELQLSRLGGTYASGTVKTDSNVNLVLGAGTKLTDGKGHFWQVSHQTSLGIGITDVSITADQVGAAWNFKGENLFWVSPIAGLKGIAKVVSIAGGSDQEALEDWRTRLLERKRLGRARDRVADIESTIKTIAGVNDVFVYPKRRGLGSLDVAITAVGSPPTLASTALMQTVQAVLDTEVGFWADCRVYAPDVHTLNLSAVVSGTGVVLQDVENTIRDYMANLAPAETYQAAVLVARIMLIDRVEDVSVHPNSNVHPVVNWMSTQWLRAGSISVSQT